MKSLLPLAAATVLFLGFSAPAQAVPKKAVSLGAVGIWEISSQSSVCLGQAYFENGTLLTYALYPRGNAQLIVSKAQWDMPKGPVTVIASIDDLPAHSLQAEADGMAVAVPWLINEDEIRLSLRVHVLHLEIGSVNYPYDLRGSAEMMRAVLNCRENLNRVTNPITGN